jgi:hypothetical protein
MESVTPRDEFPDLSPDQDPTIDCLDADPCFACAPLIDDPVAVLNDQARWPDHVCCGTSLACHQRWGQRQYWQFGVHPPAISLPMPVGGEAMERFGTRYHWHPDHMVASFATMPFAGEETAALILTLPLAEATITFYGLVEAMEPGEIEVGTVLPGRAPVRGIEGDTWVQDGIYRVAECKFTVIGSDPTALAVQNLIRNARRWWAGIAGHPLVGRPVGSSSIRDPETIRGAFRIYVREKRARPSQEELAELLAVSPRTLQRRLNELGLPWPPVDALFEPEIGPYIG